MGSYHSFPSLFDCDVVIVLKDWDGILFWTAEIVVQGQ